MSFLLEGDRRNQGKNKKLLNGKPLIQYTIEAAKNSNIQHIVVSTDDEEIGDIAKQLNVQVIQRPKELAEDNTPTLPVLQHALEYMSIEICCNNFATNNVIANSTAYK